MTKVTERDRVKAREVGKTVDRCLYRGFEDEVYEAYALALAQERRKTAEDIINDLPQQYCGSTEHLKAAIRSKYLGDGE